MHVARVVVLEVAHPRSALYKTRYQACQAHKAFQNTNGVLEAAAASDSSEDVDDHHLLYLLGEVAWGFESAAPPELLPI
ncbi:hypothetical protein QJQ45_015717, partial [Haematococcus lacustris]